MDENRQDLTPEEASPSQKELRDALVEAILAEFSAQEGQEAPAQEESDIFSELSADEVPQDAPETPEEPPEAPQAAPAEKEEEEAPSAAAELPQTPADPAPGVTVPFQARKDHTKNRRVRRVILAVVALVLLAGGIAAWYFLRPTPATEVILSESELTLRVGESERLRCRLAPTGADGTVSWKSSADHVATVENGVVTATGEGTCTITATADSGVRAMCFVTVRLPLMDEEQELVGTWHLHTRSENGRITYYYGSAYGIEFTDDRAGILTEDGEQTSFQWEYEETINGYEQYTLTLKDGRVAQMELDTNTNSTMYNTISIRFSDELLWILVLK